MFHLPESDIREGCDLAHNNNCALSLGNGTIKPTLGPESNGSNTERARDKVQGLLVVVVVVAAFSASLAGRLYQRPIQASRSMGPAARQLVNVASSARLISLNRIKRELARWSSSSRYIVSPDAFSPRRRRRRRLACNLAISLPLASRSSLKSGNNLSQESNDVLRVASFSASSNNNVPCSCY